MIDIRTADRHFKSDLGWLTSYHHFSFADYHDPENVNFGPLRVFNDDLIQPGTGFGFHPHHDMEIITYVIEGELEHRDNQGNRGIIHAGEVQVMSAGTGIVHSEYNHSKEKRLRLLQIWIFANERGLKPSWEQRIFSKEHRKNKLLEVVGPKEPPNNPLTIHQDTRVYVASLDNEFEIEHRFKQDRLGYLFMIAGKAAADDTTLLERDSIRMQQMRVVSVKALRDSEIILLDMPSRFLANGSIIETVASS